MALEVHASESNPVTEALNEALKETPEVKDPGATVSPPKEDPKASQEASTETKDPETKDKPAKEPKKAKADTKDAKSKDDPEDKDEEKDSKSKDKPEEGRIVELSRSKRAAESKAAKAEERATKAEAELAKLQPVIQLLEVAATDPLEFITQLAAATGLTPDKVQQVITTKAAGGEPSLDVADKLAALEKRLADKEAADALKAKEAEEKAKEQEYAQARAKNVSSTLEFINANAEEYPALAADGEDGAEAVYEVVEARWAALKEQGRPPTTQAAMTALYKKAAERVNKLLVEQTERRAAKLGYAKQDTKASKDAPASKKEAPKSFKGLSSETAGGNSPPNDPKRLWSDDEVLAAGNRIFGIS